MVIAFDKEYLQELYDKGVAMDKKHRYQPEVVKLYIKRIQILQKAESVEELYQMNSLHYEVLDGDKQGISSIRVNRKYRIEFLVNNTTVEPVVTVCNILELSNHYQ
ncbi:MAG: type II toxin-antitoxin system RelE/ParE family toxin [Bacteroidales bacterium]|nr:type II toxin-antitoxin system RelE/ParE family toxin [Bacteroidales bacterium]